MWEYESLKALVADESLPLMLVDLDVLDANVERIASQVRQSGKTLRIASKSVRVPVLLKRMLDKGGDVFRGVMCYSTEEAAFLASEGLDDLLIAYPTMQPQDFATLYQLTQEGVCITLMVDCAAHLDALESFYEEHAAEDSLPLRVCVDVDMSYRVLGQHLGVQRSPIRDVSMFSEFLDLLEGSSAVTLDGVMGYEAQIAGLCDDTPFGAVLNPVKQGLKQLSIPDVAARRKAIVEEVERRGLALRFFNGGGTGSLKSTLQESWLTEVTAGSGFLQSHLFDYYKDNQNEPAFCFALQITRIPEPGIVTCHSGGFVASGEAGADKQPVPFRPEGLQPISTEGFGEVQTPLRNPAMLSLHPGDPVFCRPAKAGEIAERFQEYLLLQAGEKVGRVKTYRGLGHCFY